MAIEILKRPFRYCFSGNNIYYQLYSALAAADPSIIFEIRVVYKHANEAGYTTLKEIPFAPVEGFADFDIKDILESVLENELPGFAADEKTIWQINKQTALFYIESREVTADNAAPTWDSSEADYQSFVVKGGISYFKFRGNNFWLNYFGSVTANPIPFLTWQQSGRLASPSERMYLAFLNDTSIESGNIKAQAKVYFTDGTSAVIYKLMPAIKGAIYQIPAGADQWGLAALDVNKKIAKWHIQLWDYTDPLAPAIITDPFIYEADNRNDYNGITLSYRNSLGGLDSIRVRGVISKPINYSFNEIETVVAPGYYDAHFITPQKSLANKKEKLLWKGDIGHLEKEEQDRLRDMNLSEDSWWEVEKKWWPVNIVTPDLSPLTTSEDSRWHMPIEFTLGDVGSEFYTPDSVSLGDGVFTSNVCLARVNLLDIEKDLSGTLAHVTITLEEIDPQDASTSIEWRILNNDTGVVEVDWTEQPYEPIEFDYVKNVFFIIEIRSICTNNIKGIKTSARVQTITDPAAPGDPDVYPANIRNYSNKANGFILYREELDGTGDIGLANGFLGSNGIWKFYTQDYGPCNLRLEMSFPLGGGFSFSPPRASFTSNSLVVNGVISGNIILFSNAIIAGGFQIKLY